MLMFALTCFCLAAMYLPQLPCFCLSWHAFASAAMLMPQLPQFCLSCRVCVCLSSSSCYAFSSSAVYLPQLSCICLAAVYLPLMPCLCLSWHAFASAAMYLLQLLCVCLIRCVFASTVIYLPRLPCICLTINDKGPGYDEVPIFVYKENATCLLPIILHICNKSSISGRFPSELTVGKMTCLLKAGNRKHPGNYTPITILPSFSKILEKILKTQLQEDLLSSELLVPE